VDGVRLFPVRHHSPAAARLVRDLVRSERPAAVLVEGPADFDEARIARELPLDHAPPIAIYSSVVLPGRGRAGAYHPFCTYSPEWQALREGLAVGARVAFVDLPWAAVAGGTDVSHRYADHELRRSSALPELCRRLGVDDFDAAWDVLVEIDPDLTLADYLARCEALCAELRGDGPVPALDARREAFMAARIAAVRAELDAAGEPGEVLVVCGGFHTAGLRALLAGPVPAQEVVPPPEPGDGRVVALTPYSYAALDALTGYDAGMPNPGFYEEVWRTRTSGGDGPAQVVLARIVAHLRERDQLVSAADLVALGTTAGGLAALRGHVRVWRTDLVDGILGALVKDELELGVPHPLLAAAHEVLRGGEHGRLAPGVERPPFVLDLTTSLVAADLVPARRPRTVVLDLAVDLERSRLLHRLAVLGLPGFDALDVVSRPERGVLTERWGLREDRGFEGAAVEAAGYGPTVAEAAAATLLERLAPVERDAGAAAAVLVESALCGLGEVSGPLLHRTNRLVTTDASLASVVVALRSALHLYRYEQVLGTAGDTAHGGLVTACLARALWLLDPGGGAQPPEDAGVEAIVLVLEVHERTGTALDVDREEVVDVLTRLRDGSSGTAVPALRGAALGGLWLLDAVDDDGLAGAAPGSGPELGDFLHGLFRVAREPVSRRPDLLGRIDRIVTGWSDDAFLDAVPALRRAFSAFTPREKDLLARTLFAGAAPARTAVPPGTVAAFMAIEAGLRAALDRYGIRG
jgi:hypothetical protein